MQTAGCAHLTHWAMLPSPAGARAGTVTHANKAHFSSCQSRGLQVPGVKAARRRVQGAPFKPQFTARSGVTGLPGSARSIFPSFSSSWGSIEDDKGNLRSKLLLSEENGATVRSLGGKSSEQAGTPGVTLGTERSADPCVQRGLTACDPQDPVQATSSLGARLVPFLAG